MANMPDGPPLHRVEVSFVGAAPARQVESASGVSDVEVDGSILRCLVCGSFQPFLEALRGHEVGRATLPPEPQMNTEIARYRARTSRRYARSARDTIQVDFLAYLREIRRERRRGAKRDGVSRAITAPPPASRILQQAGAPLQAAGHGPAASGRM
jgi:hypothetical protein